MTRSRASVAQRVARSPYPRVVAQPDGPGRVRLVAIGILGDELAAAPATLDPGSATSARAVAWLERSAGIAPARTRAAIADARILALVARSAA